MENITTDEVFREEQWTTTSFTNFPLEEFKKLDEAVENMEPEELLAQKESCEAYLEQNSRAIGPMYVLGLIALANHPHEDNWNLLTLTEEFSKRKRWHVVEFLCNRILDRSENRQALNFLGRCYKEQGLTDKMYMVYIRFVQVDHDEIAIVREIAERAKESGDNEMALEYYKMAFNRTIVRSEGFTNIQQLFENILELDSENFEYLSSIADKVAVISPASGVAVLHSLERANRSNIDKQIICEKKILNIDQEDLTAKRALVENYRKKYKDHSRLESCLSQSGLDARFVKDIIHSIEDFETSIAFDRGTFVYQESTKRLGRVRSISEEEVTIDFVGQIDNGTTMTSDMAFKSLKALPKSHIRVLKGCVKPEKLRKKVESDVPWALNILLKSFDGKCSLKQMKKELVPDVLTQSKWTTWNKTAKKLLMNDSLYDVSPDDKSFVLRETPVSYEEKQLTIFNSHPEFYDKVRDLKKFLADKGDINSEYFYMMIRYFSNILDGRKDMFDLDTETMGSYLLLEDLLTRKKMTFIKIPQEINFPTLLSKLEDERIPEFFKAIDDPDLKKGFIDGIVEYRQDWNSLLLKLFPNYLTGYIPEIYKQKKRGDEFLAVYKTAVEEFRDYSNMLIYLIKNGKEANWEKVGISAEKLIFTELETLSFLNIKIDARVDGQESSANAKILTERLLGKVKKSKGESQRVDDGLIPEYLTECGEDGAKKIYSLVDNCHGLPEGEKVYVRSLIKTRYPDLFSSGEPVTASKRSVPTGWFCTQASFDAKQAELDHIQHVDLPEVAKEIGIAREMGDLRENSEYKYGKERQSFLNNRAHSLKDELDKAIVVSHDSVDPTITGFGTRVTFLDNLENKELVYTLMGPWDSDPENGVINILAPLGNSLCSCQEGENIKFDINGTPYDLTCKKIEVVDFD